MPLNDLPLLQFTSLSTLLVLPLIIISFLVLSIRLYTYFRPMEIAYDPSATHPPQPDYFSYFIYHTLGGQPRVDISNPLINNVYHPQQQQQPPTRYYRKSTRQARRRSATQKQSLVTAAPPPPAIGPLPEAYHAPLPLHQDVDQRVRQPYDAFLVLDVEATCVQGQDFNWCNEIIELPVVLLRWADKTSDGKASQLVRIDEFRTFVRPIFRPILSDFCVSLTGISQTDVDNAPTFLEALPQLRSWLANHGLICPDTSRRLQNFIWCTDGPFDIRDFVVKQCFISKVKVPDWLRQDVIDVRRVVSHWAFTRQTASDSQPITKQYTSALRQGSLFHKSPSHFRPPSLNIVSQLKALSLTPFEGRQHCGLDDARNIARIVTELARRGLRLESNIKIDPGRRWYWMGAHLGEIWEKSL